MERAVIWTEQAPADPEEIERFIEQDSPFYAKAVVSRILDVAKGLIEHLQMGRVVSEFDLASVWERIVYSDRLVYRLSDRNIEIIAVIHGRRQMAPVAQRLDP
ncbi:MAG: type II toxin-antitoxin system RelE/ParE family toxin [Panacagrimonas sp.]